MSANFFDWIGSPPTEWPQFWRRLFLLTFPISAPALIAGWLLVVCLMLVLVLVYIPFHLAYWLWTGEEP